MEEMIILKWILKEWGERTWTLASSVSRQGPWVGSCEHSNEPFDSIKEEKYLDQLSDYHISRTLLQVVTSL
jgi:hypothetical protein